MNNTSPCQKKTQEDLRYKKTEALIQKTFREMLSEMDYLQITIRELADRAQINRKTFYLHYPSMDDLLYKLQKDMLERFFEPVKDARIPSDLEKIVRNCYECSEASDALDQKIFSSKGHFPIAEPDIENTDIVCFDASYDHLPMSEKRFLLVYINGCLSEIYKQWVRSGRREPMEEMIRLTLRLILNGIGLTP